MGDLDGPAHGHDPRHDARAVAGAGVVEQVAPELHGLAAHRVALGEVVGVPDGPLHAHPHEPAAGVDEVLLHALPHAAARGVGHCQRLGPYERALVHTLRDALRGGASPVVRAQVETEQRLGGALHLLALAVGSGGVVLGGGHVVEVGPLALARACRAPVEAVVQAGHPAAEHLHAVALKNDLAHPAHDLDGVGEWMATGHREGVRPGPVERQDALLVVKLPGRVSRLIEHLAAVKGAVRHHLHLPSTMRCSSFEAMPALYSCFVSSNCA